MKFTRAHRTKVKIYGTPVAFRSVDVSQENDDRSKQAYDAGFGGSQERWSMDVVPGTLADGRPFRILIVVDHWSRL